MLDNVVILKRANRQFQSICDYLVDEFGESVADAFESEVERCVTTLVKFPEAGHPEPIDSKYIYRSKVIFIPNPSSPVILQYIVAKWFGKQRF